MRWGRAVQHLIDRYSGRTLYASWPASASKALFLAIIVLTTLPALPHAPLYIPGERGWGAPAQKISDMLLYQQIVADVESGRDYYEAAAAEHRIFHYPTLPAQVFRPPTLAWILAGLHFYSVQFAALLSLYGAIIVLFYRELLIAGKSFPARVTSVAAVATGMSVAGLTGAVYWHEVWAALLIALSLLSYRAASWRAAVLFGFLACLIREIAVPYMLVMAGFALYERRWKQFLAWSGATILFSIVFTLHLLLASKLHRPGDIVSGSWLAFGGWDFVIATAKWNVLLHMLPYPLIALALCLGVVGLAGARDDRARRAAVMITGYVIAFLVVGRPDNYYWGILYTPLLPVGFLLAPAAFCDLFRSVFSSPPRDLKRASATY